MRKRKCVCHSAEKGSQTTEISQTETRSELKTATAAMGPIYQLMTVLLVRKILKLNP